MASLYHKAWKLVIRTAVRPVFNPRVSLANQRRWMRVITAGSRPPRGTEITTMAMGAARGLRLCSTRVASQPGAVLYLHGGGYCIGSAKTHLGLTGRLARSAAQPVYSLDYRLAPEHPYPAALDDALAAYRWLLEVGGYPAERISIAGDSAGGGLALALALRLRELGLPMPAALLLISPWTDLTLSGASMQVRQAQDPMLSPAMLVCWAGHYLQAVQAREPACSPLFASLTDLPPTLIHVGGDEVVHSDTTRLASALQAAGVAVECHEWQGLWHDFPLQAGLLGEANRAIDQMAAFVRQQQHR